MMDAAEPPSPSTLGSMTPNEYGARSPEVDHARFGGAYDEGLVAMGDEDEVTLQDGGALLVQSMSNWFIPRLEHGEDDGRQDESAPDEVSSPREASDDAGLAGGTRNRRGLAEASGASFKIDVTFENAEINLKRDLKKQYLAIAIGCWVLLTVIQSVSLVCLQQWQYSPVVIAVLTMTLSTVFYWRYIWRRLQLPFRRLWETPYPFAVVSAVLGSLAEHAMYLVSGGFDVGQLLIAIFLCQSFYVILVASTYRNYMSKWQKFINHRKLCHDALQIGRAKLLRESLHDDGGRVDDRASFDRRVRSPGFADDYDDYAQVQPY